MSADPVEALRARYVAAWERGEPWGSAMLAAEVRAILPRRRVGRQELARDLSAAAPSPVMSSKRAPGTTGAPGGKWYATPNSQRKRPVERFTLARVVVERLPELAAPDGNKSAYVERLIREDAARRGIPIESDP